jgi:thiazolylpeptide-type bacteriocin precursor
LAAGHGRNENGTADKLSRFSCRKEYTMALTPELADLASEMLNLESETFEISDYNEFDGKMMGALPSTSCDSSSCSSSTCTSTTSCSCA